MTKKSLIELNKILNDKTSGSTEIVLELNKFFQNNARDYEVINTSILKAEKKLAHFAVINNYLKDLKKIVRTNDHNKILLFTNEFKNAVEIKYQKLYKNAKEYLLKADNILTISNSATLLEVFKRLKKDNRLLKIVVAESRPKDEGRLFANALAKHKIKVELITDAMVSLFIPQIDAVVLGADAILKSRNIINKVGSKSAALLCRHYKKPCYVITTKDKITSKNKFHQTKQNPGEIWNFEDKNIKIINYYFEEIEKNLITKIITD